MQRRNLIALMLVCLLLASTSLIQAQDATNALRDGGFEGQYTSRGRSDFNIPADWNVWVATAPRTEAWMNLDPVAFPHNGPGPNPQSGARAQNFNRGFATFTVALYQTVAVTPGSNLIGSAFAYLKTCNPAPGFDNCGSAVESGAFTRVGIDPAGGTDPNNPAIVWSTNAQPHDQWVQMTVNATATGGSVTFFIYATQRFPAQINNVYIDTASLTGGGAGGAAATTPGAPPPTAVPPPPANVPFVVAQGQRDDGSIVHVVQSGDTLDSIAFAYGVTRAELMELNNLRDARIIQPGQELIIRPPQEAEATERPTRAPTATRGASAANAPAATEQATAEATEEPTTEAPEATEEVTTDAATEPTVEATAAPLDIAALPTAPVREAGSDVAVAADPATLTGQVCALIFDDLNRNRIQEDGEATLAGGIIQLAQDDEIVATRETDGSEPFCFDDLIAGEYVASASAPQGYGFTTSDQFALRVTAGSQVTLPFGVGEGLAVVVLPPADSAAPDAAAQTTTTNAPSNPIMDNLGLIALAAAASLLVIGLGIAFLLRRR